LVALQLQFLLLLEVDRRQHPVSNMLALWVVEELDVVEHVLAGLFAGFVFLAPDTFALEQVEKALHDGIVTAIPAAAQAGDQILLL
jgi:hypothetical protein